MIPLFEDAIIRRFGKGVLARVEEQLVSTDFEDSNCEGLVRHLLGIAPRNERYGSGQTPFKKDYGFPNDRTDHDDLDPLQDHLVARADINGMPREDISRANVCVYREPGGVIGHLSLYIGTFRGVPIQFDQLPGERPSFNPIPGRTMRKGEPVFHYPYEYYFIRPRILP